MAPPKKEDKLTLAVVIYQPREGNFMHWAFHVYDVKTEIYRLYEVVGDSGEFEARTVDVEPSLSTRFRKSIDLGTVNQTEFGQLESIIGSVPVDNETTEWNCQDYVIEIMDKLELEYFLDVEDEDYREAKAEVKEKFGPM
jgi:hypothetical protein